MSDITRRSLITRGSAVAAGAVAGGGLLATPASASEKTSGLTPGQALARLRAGNRRYVASRAAGPNRSRGRRVAQAEGQTPFASILSCSDSRVPPELVFDRGLGDLFIVRLAGNVTSPEGVGSLEFAAEEFGVPLIVVMGHEACGAVKATKTALEDPNFKASENVGALAKSIAPSVEAAKKAGAKDIVESAINFNAKRQARILRQNPVLAPRIADGRLAIVSARYDLETGRVSFL
ncbi:carbonic anhydrase [Conexibacter sp. W3-3-2]|uniref:carbonic anhydrase n=1 Tax=Conexibacter sp. W3-3-2 TaxID=2675227 RepID=UPI0012B9748E|nr:carbonic anhydrase [Conexibacter sp. W3-3-2]MTD45965.1 carbonic anhydrase [Conexibacter sp. W3-3-2]